MADRTPAAATAAPLPDEKTISRAEELVRERFLMPEEDPAHALAPGTPRRNALDAAVAELEAGATVPSTEWRRRYSMLLGLERVLSDDEPKLADGTSLNPHQVDALSGTLTALLADQQRNAPPSTNGTAIASAAPAPVATAAPSNGAPAADPVLDEDVDADSDVDPDEDSDDSDETAAEAEAILQEDVDEDEEPLDYDAAAELELDEEDVGEAPEDPNAHKRFWFEHATGAGKTVAAMGFVDASRTGGVLILTHRRNLVDQFNEELRTRGYRDRVRGPMLGDQDAANGPVTVETYQWFVRNAGNISSAYTVVICDEAHTALGEKTAAAIRNWTGPIFIGMTATGALIARHVTDLFPTQTSRFDLAQAARRGVIAPLRCVRIPPGVGVRTIAKVPLRRGEVDTEFDQELLAELLDQLPFNLAAADLYKTRFNGMPGVVYAAGVRHAYNLAEAFRAEGIKAEGVSGETPKRQLAEILAKYERGDIDVLINAQLLAEGWNSPRATVCFHLAPTASKRIYQQRVGRVTRRHPGKEAGIVVDFVAPGTKHDEPTITLHSLLDRDVYRGGAIVVGPVRRGRGRRVRVERRVLPVAADENRRIEVFERELWRIAVEHLDWGEQIQWAALAGARVSPSGWRRARAMLHFDRTGDLKRAFLLTAVQRNKNPQLRLRALQEIAASRDAEAFDTALDEVGGWPRDEKREACKLLLQSLAEKRIGRRDQADAWIWRVAGYTAELHEEYAVQRWPETKRLLGLLANSSGGGHARNARRLVHAGRKQDRRLAAAILAAATRYTHTPEAEEVLRGARTRLSRKPSSLSRELLRNFPKGRRGRSRRRKKKGAEGDAPQVEAAIAAAQDATDLEDVLDDDLILDEALDVDSDADSDAAEEAQAPRSRRRRNRGRRRKAPVDEAAAAAAVAEAASALAGATGATGAEGGDDVPFEVADAAAAVAETGDGSGGSRRSRGSRRRKQQPPADVQAAIAAVSAAAGDGSASGDEPAPSNGTGPAAEAAAAVEAEVEVEAPAKPKVTRSRAKKAVETDAAKAAATVEAEVEAPAKPKATRSRAKKADDAASAGETPKPKRASRAKKPAAAAEATDGEAVAEEAPKPKRATRAKKAVAADAPADDGAAVADEAPKPKRATRAKKADADADAAPKPKRTSTTEAAADAPAKPKRPSRAKKTADDAGEPAESSAA